MIFHYFMSFIHCYVIGRVGLQGSYAHGKHTKVMEFYYSSEGIELKITACLDIFFNISAFVFNILIACYTN